MHGPPARPARGPTDGPNRAAVHCRGMYSGYGHGSWFIVLVPLALIVFRALASGRRRGAPRRPQAPPSFFVGHPSPPGSAPTSPPTNPNGEQHDRHSCRVVHRPLRQARAAVLVRDGVDRARPRRRRPGQRPSAVLGRARLPDAAAGSRLRVRRRPAFRPQPRIRSQLAPGAAMKTVVSRIERWSHPDPARS